MYYSYYGLTEKPFELAPDGSYVYMSETHKEGLATLRYGVIANKGFLLMTGGVGVGKTTLLNALLRMVQKKVIVCLLNNPTLNKKEFFYYLANQFSLPFKNNKSSFIINFKKLLGRCEETGEKILLVIDEAQAFPIDLLEEIRLLSNLAGESNVFSIFLVGQPEIREQLATSQLLPLRQRIGIRYHLEPLTEKDTAHYIHHRLANAGASKTTIFTEEAIATIHDASQGNPRLINIICDHAMLSGFAKDLKVINRTLIVESIEELRLPGEATLQTSDLVKQLRPQRSVVERLPSSEPSPVVERQKPPIEIVDTSSGKRSAEAMAQTELQSLEDEARSNKKRSPLAHFMIALVLMSVIIVMGIMLPSEIAHVISGAK